MRILPVCAPYLGHISAGVGVARGVMAEGWQTGQDEVDGSNLQSHAAEQNAVVSGQRSAAEQRSQHVERQRGQHVGRRRLQDVTYEDDSGISRMFNGPL